MKPTHIEHIGIAVYSFKDTVSYYEMIFGLKCCNIEEVQEQKVKRASHIRLRSTDRTVRG